MDENRRLAEWMGYRVISIDVTYSTEPRYALVNPTGERISQHIYQLCEDVWEDGPDFSGDEAASAMLLEKMPEPDLCKEGRFWYCNPDWHQAIDNNPKYVIARDCDRKTAIKLAALKLIERDGK